MTVDVGILHMRHRYGAQRQWYRDIPSFDELLRDQEIPDEEAMWGWGHFHRSEGDYEAHLKHAFDELPGELDERKIPIDAIVLGAPCLNNVETLMRYTQTYLCPALGVPQSRVHTMEEGDCVNTLQALKQATTLLASGLATVLILAAEKVEDETRRVSKFALFSDCSLACVVARGLSGCTTQVVDVLIEEDPDPRWNADGILTRTLDRQCVKNVLMNNALTHAQIAKAFYINLYEPIVDMKIMDMGFSRDQLAVGDAREHGHCFGVDPFRNMQASLERGGAFGTSILCASGRRHAGAAVVKTVAKP